MIQLVTDSAANIPEDLLRRFDVTVVPIRVRFGDETFREGIDLSTAEFFERLETSDALPTTTPPSLEDFVTVYQSALDTLEYLRRGGRIGRAGAFLGTMLRIKPVLQIRDGIVEPVDRISGRKRALERLIDIVYERYADGSVWVGIGDVAAEADAAMLREATTEQLEVEYSLQSSIGPVVATHAGPGTVGVAVSPVPAFEG